MDQDMFIYSDESEQDEDYFSDADDDDYSHEARNTTDCDCDVNDNDNGNDIAPPHSTINTIDNTTTMVKTTTTTTRQTNNNDSDNDNDIKQKGKQKQQYIENNSNSNDDFFSIMDSSKLRSAQAAAIHDVMSICCVSESIAFQLLKHYQWSNVSHAVEEWFTKEDQLRKTLGLGHNTDSDNDGTNTNFFNNSCTNSRHDSWSDTTNNTHVSSDMAIDINNTINKEENENKAIHFIKCGICLEMCPESDLISSPACDGIKCDSNRPISSSSGTLDSSSNNNNNNNEALCDTERSMKTTESSSSQSQPHLFCHSCYYEYVRSAVSDGPANCLTLTCPMPQCKTLLPISFIKTCLRYTNKDDGKYSHGSSKSIPMPTTYTEGDRMRDRFERFMLESYVNDNASIKWCPAPNCEMAIKINNKNMNSKNKTQRRRSDSRRSLSRSKSIQISSNNPNHNNNGSSVSFSLSPRSDFYCNSNTSNANNNSAGGFASSMEDAEILQDCVDFSDDSSDDEGCPNASPSQKHLPCCRCSCGFSFCYTCGSEYHSPVSCSIVRQWQLKCANEADNLNWILENAKPCPSCSRPIEKNHGCMHMTCSVCKHEFCWLCGEPWSVHSQKTGGFYACNRYKTNNNNNNNNNGNQTLSRQVGEVRRNTTSIYTNTSINTNMAGNYASRAILGRRVEDATNTTTTNGSLSRLIDYADLGADGDEVLLERRRQQEEERLLFGGPSTGTSDNNASNTTTTTTTTTNGNGIDMTSIGNVTIQNIDRGGASSSGTNNNNTKNGWNWTANSTINNNTMNMNRISSKPSRYGKNNGSIFGSRNDDNDEHSLQRYLHYYERYNAHEKARVQAQQQHDYVELGIISNNNKNSKNKNSKNKNKDGGSGSGSGSGSVMKTRPFLLELCERLQMPLSQLKFISEALEQVVECRRVLKWTYAYGYLLDINTTTTRSADWEAKKNFFEFQQGEAEWSLEKLHEEVEKTMGKLMNVKGMSHSEQWRKQKNKNKSKDTNMTNIIDRIENNNDEDDNDNESKKKSRFNVFEPCHFQMAWQSSSYPNAQDQSATKTKNKNNNDQRQSEGKQTTKKKRGSSNSLEKEIQGRDKDKASSSTSALFVDIAEFDAFRCTLTGLTSVTKEYFDSLVSGLQTGHTLSAIGKGIDFSASV